MIAFVRWHTRKVHAIILCLTVLYITASYSRSNAKHQRTRRAGWTEDKMREGESNITCVRGFASFASSAFLFLPLFFTLLRLSPDPGAYRSTMSKDRCFYCIVRYILCITCSTSLHFIMILVSLLK